MLESCRNGGGNIIFFPLQTSQDGAPEFLSIPPQTVIIYPSPAPNEPIHNSQQYVIIQTGYDRIPKKQTQVS